MRLLSPAFNSIPERTNVLNELWVTVKVYLPKGRAEKVYPAWSVVLSYFAWVPSSIKRTLAPTITAPVVSVITPLKELLLIWPRQTVGSSATTTKKRNVSNRHGFLVLFMIMIASQLCK